MGDLARRVRADRHLELCAIALADGVALIPGPAGGHARNAPRLCFASSTPERIEEGIARLTGILEKMAR